MASAAQMFRSSYGSEVGVGLILDINYRGSQMNEPAAIWALRKIVFDKEIGSTQNVILSQASEALSAVMSRIATLRKLVASSPIQSTYTAPEIPSVLSDLCYQAGIASTILFNDAKRGRKESALAYELRQKRLKYINYWCNTQNLKTPTLRDRSVRNALTHMDEYLADALTKENSVGWFIDIAIESRGQFAAPQGIKKVGFCRSYVRAEDKILHLDREISLSALEEECVALLAVVFGVTPRAT